MSHSMTERADLPQLANVVDGSLKSGSVSSPVVRSSTALNEASVSTGSRHLTLSASPTVFVGGSLPLPVPHFTEEDDNRNNSSETFEHDPVNDGQVEMSHIGVGMMDEGKVRLESSSSTSSLSSFYMRSITVSPSPTARLNRVYHLPPSSDPHCIT